MGSKMHFPLFTTIPPKSDFQPFIENWKRHGFSVTSINNSEEAPILRAAGVDVLEVNTSQKRLRISEMMHEIASTGASAAGFINADCRFALPMDIARLRSESKNSIILAERLDTDLTGIATKSLSYGFDAFFFDAAHLKSIPIDSDYRVGTPWWDFWFPLLMQRSGLTLKRFKSPVLLHLTHDLNWDHIAYVKFGLALQAEFPSLHIVDSGMPNGIRCFDYILGKSEAVSLLDDSSTQIEGILSSIHSLVREIHNMQWRADAALAAFAEQQKSTAPTYIFGREYTLQKENEALKQALLSTLNSRSFRITYPLRIASLVTQQAINRMQALLLRTSAPSSHR